MKVKAITKYKYNGKEYDNLKDIQNDIHNIIGENVIDKINKTIDIRHKDLFKHHKELPKEVIQIIDEFNDNNISNYHNCKVLIAKLNEIGYTCKYDLSAVPYGLSKINPFEAESLREQEQHDQNMFCPNRENY